MLNELEQKYWDHYLFNNNISINENTLISATIAGNVDIADNLLHLYLSGKKTAGSGLIKDYLFHEDPLPEPGNYWIILNSKKIPKCIVKTIHVEIHLFKNIPERIAIAEGEGDLSIDYWKKAHHTFFTPFLKQLNIKNLDEEEIVTEFFEIVFKSH